MQVKITQVNHGKTQKGKDKTGLYDGKTWFNILGIHDLAGKTVELEEGGFPSWYNLKRVVEDIAPDPEQSSNGQGTKITWPEFQALIQQAHELTKKLEPDLKEPDMPIVDRASARHAILATILISYGKGAFEFPEIPFMFLFGLLLSGLPGLFT